MTLVSTIIQDGYRESNLIAASATPSTDQTAEALRLLNRMIAGLRGNEAGDQLLPLPIGHNNISRPSGYPYYNPVPDTTDWFVPLNAQLVLNVTQPVTVWLHPKPQDGSRFAIIDKSANLSSYPLTVTGNGYTIEGGTTKTFNTNSQVAEYMFRADTGDWAKASDLASSDNMPFPEDFDDLFTIGLAIRLNPRYEQTADQLTIASYKNVLSQFKARYRQVIEVPSERGLVLTPGSRQGRYWGSGNSTADFNSGYGFTPRIW